RAGAMRAFRGGHVHRADYDGSHVVVGRGLSARRAKAVPRAIDWLSRRRRVVGGQDGQAVIDLHDAIRRGAVRHVNSVDEFAVGGIRDDRLWTVHAAGRGRDGRAGILTEQAEVADVNRV